MKRTTRVWLFVFPDDSGREWPSNEFRWGRYARGAMKSRQSEYKNSRLRCATLTWTEPRKPPRRKR